MKNPPLLFAATYAIALGILAAFFTGKFLSVFVAGFLAAVAGVCIVILALQWEENNETE